jgi:EpsD family peptidyl-prolyl cis-trans isomerase
LQRIILRRLLAQEAKKQKLDKSPDFAVQMKRGEENLLAQLYQRKLVSAVSQPTRQEADAYVASHPDQFANRQVYVVDQVISAPNKISPDRFRPLTTLDQVKALLDQENVPYQTNAATIDTIQANPDFVAQLKKLPPGEVFVIPQRGVLTFNQISATRTAPFVGDMAANYAMQALRQQKAQESVGKKIEAMRKAAEKSIVYNEGFKPASPTAKLATPAAATPAPATAPAAAPAAPATK